MPIGKPVGNSIPGGFCGLRATVDSGGFLLHMPQSMGPGGVPATPSCLVSPAGSSGRLLRLERASEANGSYEPLGWSPYVYRLCVSDCVRLDGCRMEDPQFERSKTPLNLFLDAPREEPEAKRLRHGTWGVSGMPH